MIETMIMNVVETDIRPGDIIHGYWTSGPLPDANGMSAVPDPGWKVTSIVNGTIQGIVGKSITGIRTFFPKRPMYFRVSRPDLDANETTNIKIQVVVDSAKARLMKQGWNGTCLRCGRGTYEGATKLEHEGGGCKL